MGILELELGGGEFIVKVGKDDQIVHTDNGYSILFRGVRSLESIAANEEIVNKNFIPTDLIVAGSYPGTTDLVEVFNTEIPQGAIAYVTGVDKMYKGRRFVPIQFYKKL